MDLLADVLGNIQFKGTVYCQTEFTAPWGVQWEGRTGRAGFFMVVRGGCYMEFGDGRTPISLAPGDFVMSPRARGYTLRDAVTSPVTKFDDVLIKAEVRSIHRLIKHGGGGQSTKIIMGCFDLDTSSENPFVRSLPDFILVRSEDLQAELWLETSLRFLAAECAAEKLGSTITISGLTELIFVQAIRVYIAQEDSQPFKTGWLNAVADPQIGKVLSAIHEAPGDPWTVASLADVGNMSRSAFAAKFRTLVDMTPLDYLTAWRIYRAQKLLRAGKHICDVASEVGYQSEAAFSKAFKRGTGLAPGAFRRGGELVEAGGR